MVDVWVNDVVDMWSTIVAGAVNMCAAFQHTLQGRDMALLKGYGSVQRGILLATGPAHGEPLVLDLGIFILFAVAFFVANWIVRLAIAEPMAAVLLRPAAPSSPRAAQSPRRLAKAKRQRRADVQKFAQSFLEMVTYGAFSVIGYIIVSQQEWAWPSSNWWTYDRPTASMGGPGMREDVRCYYILYCARYCAGGVTVLLEHKRKDFYEMLLHHWVTVVLVALSYVGGWYRVGAIVMVLLDPADVPLHIAKMHKYIADARKGTKLGGWLQFGADRWFEVFAVVFIIMRGGMYAYCCWSSHGESRRHTVLNWDGWTCVGLLYTLLGLQYYWIYLIISAAIRMAQKGGIEDVRSDDEDDDDAAEEKKKN